jgi:hypothetical protein
MYEKEADELINLVLTVPADAEDFGGRSRTREVADWLREFVAASNYGCTGLTADPDGPELAHEFADCPNGPYGCRVCLPGRTVAKPGKNPPHGPERDAPGSGPDLSGLPEGAAELLAHGFRTFLGEQEPSYLDLVERQRRQAPDGPESDAPGSGRHPDAYAYGEPWGPDNPAPGSSWGRRPG